MTSTYRENLSRMIWGTVSTHNFHDLSEECKLTLRENDCRSMIDSILAYSPWDDNTTAEEIMQMEENNYHNYLADYVNGNSHYMGLGRERVVELIAEQMADIDHIETDTHTDSEGVTYNTIIWKNER